MLQKNKKERKSCDTVVKFIYYELGAINLHWERAAISVSTILVSTMLALTSYFS